MAARIRKAFGRIRLWEDRAGIAADADAARARRDGPQETRDGAQDRQDTGPQILNNYNSTESSESSNEPAYFAPSGLPAPVEAVIDKEYVKAGICGVISSPQILACTLISTLGGFLVGYDQGVLSVAVGIGQFSSDASRIQSNASDSRYWSGFLVAIIELGSLTGALIQGWLTDKGSRKRSFIIAAGVFCVGNALQCASQTFIMLVVSRFVAGIGLGMLSMVVPLYIAEVSPAEIRGTLLALEELAIVSGTVIAFWISFGARHMEGEWSWRLPFIVQFVPALALGLGVCFIPKTPRWLVTVCRDEDSLAVLAKLRRLPEDDLKIQKEWTEIRAEVICQQEVNRERHPKLQETTRLGRFRLDLVLWIDCLRPGGYKRTHIGMGLTFFRQFIGTKALIYYSYTLFEGMGLSSKKRLIMLGSLYISQLLGVLSSLLTIDIYGRRPLLLWGSGLMCVCLIIITVSVGTSFLSWLSETRIGPSCVPFFWLFMLIFGATWGPVTWAVPSEIFPSNLRAKGVALSASCNWLASFVVGMVTPMFIQRTEWGAFLFFTILCLLSGLWAYLSVRETNNLTLEEMDLMFDDAADGAAEEERRQRIRRHLDSSDSPSPLRLPRGSV